MSATLILFITAIALRDYLVTLLIQVRIRVITVEPKSHSCFTKVPFSLPHFYKSKLVGDSRMHTSHNIYPQFPIENSEA